MSAAKKQHVKILYRFGGIRLAYDFQNLVIRCGVPAAAKFAEHFGWYVETDSRCLEHATKLAPFIYKGAK